MPKAGFEPNTVLITCNCGFFDSPKTQNTHKTRFGSTYTRKTLVSIIQLPELENPVPAPTSQEPFPFKQRGPWEALLRERGLRQLDLRRRHSPRPAQIHE